MPLSGISISFVGFAIGLIMTIPSDALAQSDEDLAKQLQNPVANLISVPFQNNIDFGLGPDDDALRYGLNIQPVVPMSLNNDWNLISRTILPVIYQEQLSPGLDDEFGLGDTVQSLFLSPKQPTNGTIWGLGPVFLLPTATDRSLGSEKFGVGPTAVGLRQQGSWTYGLLANHIWSVAGAGGRDDVDATFLQPFVGHTWDNGFSVTANTESTYDWTSDQWTIPINLIASKVVTLGARPISLGVGGRYYAESPRSGPDWGIRFQVVFLFPK